MQTKASLAISPPAHVAPKVRSFVPQTANETFELAKTLASGGLVGRGLKPDAIFTVILLGAELGIAPITALRMIHVIDGKPSLSADCMVSLCMRSPHCKYFTLISSDSKRCVYEAMRVGDPKPVRLEYTIEQAQQAGVTNKDNWRKYPAQMLRARCISGLARAVFPDIISGLYDPEELGAESSDDLPFDTIDVGSGPRAIEVNEEPEVQITSEEPTTDEPAFTTLSKQLDQAESMAEINEVARATMRALQAGAITVGYVETIKKAVEKKRAALRDIATR